MNNPIKFEAWKDIPEYSEYQINSSGSIISLNYLGKINLTKIKEIISAINKNIYYLDIMKNFKISRFLFFDIRKNPSKYLNRKKILKQTKDKNGYLYVTLYRDGIGKHKYVHKLVLETFIGPCPDGMEGCHGDGNPINNNLINLRYDTPKGNSVDKIKHNTLLCGSRCVWAKLDEEKIRDIKKLLKEGKLTQKEIAKRFNVCQQTISDINKQKIWRHVI